VAAGHEAADDAILVSAAQADPRAFTLLYERYANQVHRYCFLKLGNREAAEDATSEVFLKALANLRGFRGGVFAGWLFRIAHNVVADANRQDRRSHRPLPLDAAVDIIDPTVDLEDAAIARSAQATLRVALRQLPTDQRVTLELQLTGWSTEQIAAALGRSPNAVRIIRFRAFRRLRPLLSDAHSGMESRRGEQPC
jgi:RNA polymerase sigma-70 factor (ECF subfamily)